jgi:M6 family metalloprotease-like protein
MIKFKQIFLGVVLLFSATISMQAVPAYPGALTQKQPDGSTLTYYLRGDEHFHAKYSTDGYMLRENNEGALCYVTKSDDGSVLLTSQFAHNVGERGAVEKSFLKNVTKIEFSSQYSGTVSKVARAPKRILDGTFPTKGNIRGLILLVEFSDNSFYKTHTQSLYKRIMNDSDYTDNGATGSARQYFIDQSMGQFVPDYDVVGPIKLTKPESYYGANASDGSVDANAPYMVQEACQYAHDSLGVDFSKYDNNGDGAVDFVYVIYAGYGEAYGAPSTTIWPHSSSIWSLGISLQLDGKYVGDYACSCELRGTSGSSIDGVGTFCHEFGHVLGLPDLYNTSTSDAELGSWDIMASGSYNNDTQTPPAYSAFERYSLGWMSYKDIDTPMRKMFLPELTKNNVAYRLTTKNENEYFILENRQRIGWDYYQGGKGLMITHVNYDASIWANNTVNVGSKPHVDIVEADGTQGDYSASGDLFPGKNNVTSFTDYTTPNSLTWDGDTINKPLTNILNQNDTVYFDFKKDKLDIPAVLDATEVTDSSFVANWNSVEGANSYRLEVRNNIDDNKRTIALAEDFSLMSEGTYTRSGNVDVSTIIDNYMKKSGWTGEYNYQAGGMVKIGRAYTSGSLTSPAIDMSYPQGTFTVAMKVRSYGSHVMKFIVKSYGESSDSLSQSDTLTTDSVEHTVVMKFTNGTKTTHLSFNSVSERLYIDDLRIIRGDVDSTNVWNDSIDGLDIIIDSITDTHYKVSGLTSGQEYYYTVKALSDIEQANSNYSGRKIVKLTASSAVTTLTSDAKPFTVSYYTISGIRLTGCPSQGYYIKVTTYSDGHVKSRVMKN